MRAGDLLMLFLVAVPVVVSVLTGLLRRRSAVIWWVACAALIISLGIARVFLMRLPLDQPEVWVSIIFHVVLPISTAFALTRLLPVSTSPVLVAVGGFAVTLATAILAVIVGSRMHVMFQ